MKLLSGIVVSVAVCWGAALCDAAPIPAQPVYTNKTRFRIPYRYDADEMRKLNAREIRLYLSYDRGIRWQHVQSVSPEKGRFEFEAPSDGEYWFAVRTIDGRNQLHPPGNVMEAGLKVVVDTTPPALEISLTQVSPGKVEMSWSASDPYLDPTTLRLEYIQPGSPNWQQVGVVPKPSGRTSWSVPEGGMVAVRGSVGDRASNIGRAQSQVRAEPADNAVPKPAVPDFRQPIASTESGSQLPDQYPKPSPSIRSQQQSAPNRGDHSTGRDKRDEFTFESGEPGRSTTIAPFPRGSVISDSSQTRPPLYQGRYTNDRETTEGKARGNLRLVNTLKFQIGYQVDDVGPSGISRVEMYITQNDGQKWWKYGVDEDRTSPFAIEVPEEGVYGFAIRVRSGVGLGDDPPQPGEQPDVVVAVDQTPPSIKLHPVQQGQGAALKQVLIRWQIDDEYPAERPISLSYSSNREGPWEPIAGWIEDEGRYQWTLPSDLPSNVYIRLSARDAAGNLAHATTEEAIVIDLSKPSARIVDVESIESPGYQK